MVRTLGPVRATAIGFLGFRKNQCVKCYSENAGILGILSSGAARNQFLPVQSDTFGCAVNALKMLGFVRVPVGSKQRLESRPFTTKNLRYDKTYQQQ